MLYISTQITYISTKGETLTYITQGNYIPAVVVGEYTQSISIKLNIISSSIISV